MHLNPKYFFRLNKSLHLFETHLTFLNLILTFLWAIKDTKSSHHLFHDRASKGMGLVLVLCHKLLCMHVFKGLMRCKLICDVKPGLDPCPLLARSWNRWWLDFISFIAYKKVKIKFKKAKCVSNKCNGSCKRKKYFGFRCTLRIPRNLFLGIRNKGVNLIIVSFDVQWYEWSWNLEPGPNHPNNSKKQD